MNTSLKQRDARFLVQDGYLVRVVTSDSGIDGRGYTNRCLLATLETVAHALAGTLADGPGTSLTDIARGEQLPYTQVNVALEFLKERGIVAVRHRRCYPASGDVYLDAMTEFHALREEPIQPE